MLRRCASLQKIKDQLIVIVTWKIFEKLKIKNSNKLKLVHAEALKWT